MDEQLRAEIQKSNAWMITCSDVLTGVDVPGGQRMNVAVALLHLCNEHHQAIDLLASHDINGSAFALFRPQFEAYVRAIWIFYCAEDLQINNFLAEKKLPRLELLISRVEQLDYYKSMTLSRTHDRLYKTMCSFTHGGGIQVKARFSNGQVAESYLTEHIIDLLKTSAVFSMMAAHAIARIVGSSQLADKIDVECAKIYGT